jgi:hypothetical protein
MHKRHLAFVAASAVLTILILVSPSVAAEPNHKPCLRKAQIRPIDGLTRTSFVATVEYYDPDGDVPAKVEVYVDDVPYPMQRVKGRAEHGIYRARMTLPPGEHGYYFYAEDGRGMSERYPRYGAKHGPYVGIKKPFNRIAALTNGGVYFNYGTDKGIYTYTVHYKDRDDCGPPRGVYVIVDGITHQMTLHKGTPNDGIYLYKTTLPAGSHGYYFGACDHEGDCVTLPRHGFLRGPEVAETYNTPPVLHDQNVIPWSGSYLAKFTYTVHYTDEDFDPPSLALIYVDGIPHQLKFAAGKPYAGLYIYRTRHHVSTEHEYYYHFEDGRGGVVRYPRIGTFHGPVVSRW